MDWSKAKQVTMKIQGHGTGYEKPTMDKTPTWKQTELDI
jgi:hypothetical protein